MKRYDFFAFDISRNPPEFCRQSFAWGSDGIEHWTAGVKRASIQPENMGDYLESHSPTLTEEWQKAIKRKNGKKAIKVPDRD